MSGLGPSPTSSTQMVSNKPGIWAYFIARVVTFWGMTLSLLALLVPFLRKSHPESASRDTLARRRRDYALHLESIKAAQDQLDPPPSYSSLPKLGNINTGLFKFTMGLGKRCLELLHLNARKDEIGRPRSKSDPTSDRPSTRLNNIYGTGCTQPMDKCDLDNELQLKPSSSTISRMKRNSIAAASSISTTVRNMDIGTKMEGLESDMRNLPSKVVELPNLGGKVIKSACQGLKQTTGAHQPPVIKKLKDTTQKVKTKFINPPKARQVQEAGPSIPIAVQS